MTDTIKELIAALDEYIDITNTSFKDFRHKVTVAAANARPAIKALYSENERLKRLAYHKEGITYQDLFAASLGMADEADKHAATIKLLEAESTRLREKLGEILTIAADADDDVIAELAREGLGG